MGTNVRAIAAAAAAEMQRQEEEGMTPYSPNDLAEGWEFKILRSHFGAFRDPAKLRAALQEEQRGGWVMVEKFDEYRIRLKRPASAKTIEGDFADGYDLYRTTLETPHWTLPAVLLVGAVVVLIGLLLLAVIVSVGTTASPPAPPVLRGG